MNSNCLYAARSLSYHWPRLRIITFTTDFGGRDWFTGTLEGVVSGIAPAARVIHLTHEIPPQDLRAGAFVLMASVRYFPKGSIHVAVIDPGVGSGRNAIAIQTARCTFLGPDNGVLSWALRGERVRSARAIQNTRLFLQPSSRTFHGRDLFAPVAAHLAQDVPLSKLGPELDDYVRLPWPEVRQGGVGIMGEVLYIDHFGNAITNIPEAGTLGEGVVYVVYAGSRRFSEIHPFYSAAKAGKPVAVFGSSGFLELAVHCGSAAEEFRLKPGTSVRLKFG